MVDLLIEPFGGMAGDMFLAALCDLGTEGFGPRELEELARDLVPEGCELSFTRTKRGSIAATQLDVRTAESDSVPHRHLKDLIEILGQSRLGDAARARAESVLRRIAVAEARVHGCEVEAVHFHEVGAVDTLIDVAGACLALERLGVQRVFATVPYLGGGTVHCAHGEMPIPAPGTAEILRGLPIRLGPGGERVTPTGAALLAECVESFSLPSAATLGAIGYGAGSRDPEEGPPNLLRVALLHEHPTNPEDAERREAWLLECNLDDATGEELGFLLQELRARGALEAWSVPLQMKKDRPGALIAALCRAEHRADLERVFFDHSPTLGVRFTRTERTELKREERVVEFEGQRVRVKIRLRGDGGAAAPLGRLDVSPEFDDIARVARATERSLRDVEDAVMRLVLAERV